MKANNDRPAHIGTKRLAISGYPQEDWYICWSPAASRIGSEGPWEEWVSLARMIVAEDERRRESPFLHGRQNNCIARTDGEHPLSVPA